jgi:hypothetical protein
VFKIISSWIFYHEDKIVSLGRLRVRVGLDQQRQRRLGRRYALRQDVLFHRQEFGT